MSVYARLDTVSGACGIGVFDDFSRLTGWGYDIAKSTHEGGAGWLVVGYIDTDICKEAYEILKKRFPIVFESPKRKNVNSGNEFFFVIYDTDGVIKSGYDAVDGFDDDE